MIYISAVHLEGGTGHEHIASFRWRQPSTGKAGELTRTKLVAWIRDEKGDARVEDARGDVKISVVDGHRPYLRTHADGSWTNNLLSLPRF